MIVAASSALNYSAFVAYLADQNLESWAEQLKHFAPVFQS